jgi:uncharacterized protein YhdP
MRKALKLFVWVTFSFVLFLLVISVAFYHLMQAGEFRQFLIEEVERNTGLRIQLGEAELELGRILGITFRDVSIADPQSDQNTLSATSVTARVALLPLLQRKLIFSEIQLRRPAAQILRDKDGRMPLLERLLNLPFLRENKGQFAFDLRKVKIAEGEIELQETSAEKVLAVTRLRNIDLELERVSGRALGEFFNQVVRARPHQPEGPALEFTLKTTVEQGSERAGLQAKGIAVFLGAGFEVDKVWWSAETRTIDTPVLMIQRHLVRDLAPKSLTGMLDSRLRWEGNWSQRFQVRGEVTFKGLAIEAPEVFNATLLPGDGRLEMELSWQPGHWELGRMELRSKELKLTAQGTLRVGENRDPHLQLSLTTASLPIAVIWKYLPKRWLEAGKLDSVVAGIQEGEVQLHKAGINAALSDVRRLAESGFDDGLWIDAGFRGVGALFPGGYLPLRGVQGRVTLEKGLLSLKNLKGHYGQSRVTDLDGHYRLSPPGRGALQLFASGESDLGELREQGKLGLIPLEILKGASFVEDVGGQGKFDITVRRAPDAAPAIEGKILLNRARLRIEGFSVTDIRGQLSLNRGEISAEKVRGMLDGSPIQLRLAVREYGSDKGTFDLTVDSTGIKAGVVARLLLNSGSLQDPGVVRGTIRYQGALASREGRKLAGNLDLSNVQLTTRPLRQPLKELNGRIRFDETGIDFQNIKGLLAGFPASFSGRWRYHQQPQLLFDFTAANLDLSYLHSQIEKEPSDFYGNLQAIGRIALAKGRLKEFEFSDLKTDVVIDHRVWRFKNPTLRAARGILQGEATIADNIETTGYSVTPRIQGVPVQSFLTWFEISNTEMTGEIMLNGQLDTWGKDAAERKRNLNGTFNLRIQDGTINRLRILVQILNLLDLSRWFTLQMPDLTKQGIRFRSITGDFKVNNGIYTTQNLVVDSDDLRMSGSGKIDVPKDELDFVLAVRPFAGVDTAINYIPLIGRGIAAIKNSFLVASFKISGSIDEPTITPAPLSTLSEVVFGILGIPKKIIGLGGDENKEEAPKEQTREPTSSRSVSPIP